MMDTLHSPKAIALITTCLFFGALLWLLNTQRINKALGNDLDQEKLKSESMLSEKLLLQKEIDQFKGQLNALVRKNKELDKTITTTSFRLNEQQITNEALSAENKSLKKIKKQRDEFSALNKELLNRVETLNEMLVRTRHENEAMVLAMNSLEQRSRVLEDELNKAILTSVDNTQVQSWKSNKLTVKARQAKKLVATFEVPSELLNLNYSITDPAGKIVTGKDGLIASRKVGEGKTYIASRGDHTKGFAHAQVEMTYTPNEKLKPGTYKIEILNDNLYVGSLQAGLR